MTHIEVEQGRREVRRVLLVTLLLNLAVAGAKIAIGVTSGALAITADGLHSLVDGASNVVALVANRIAGQPPDSQHPYGHRRFETIAALGIGLFLVLTAWEVVTEALNHLRSPEPLTVTPLMLVVMLGTLAVNIGVNRYETRAGKRLRSELLLADAAHTRTDIIVSLSVIASLLLIAGTGVRWLDTATALIVVVLILRTAWEVISGAGRVLVDTAPYAPEDLVRWAAEVPGVERVERARSRGPADAAHIDVDVVVAPMATAAQTAEVATAIRAHLATRLSGVSEIEIHFVPAPLTALEPVQAARVVAESLGLPAHEIHLRKGGQGDILEMHIEAPAGLTLADAHAQADALEREVKAQAPGLETVITHIEPAPAEAAPAALATSNGLAAEALKLLQVHYPQAGWHDVDAFTAGNGPGLTMHAALPAEMPLEDAHRLAEEAEALLRTALPHLERVTIHTEPLE